MSPSQLEEECTKYNGRLNQICNGVAGLDLKTTNTYRTRWGLSPLEKLPSKVAPVPSLQTRSTGKGCGGCRGESRSLPSKARQAINLTKAATKHALDGGANRPDDQVVSCLKICEHCEWFRPEDRRCAHVDCGCYVEKKATWRSENCPKGYWKPMKWAYGVTTVPERMDTYLPEVLITLTAAGFPEPHLFIDGEGDYSSFGLKYTQHNTPTRTFGNWILSLWELYIRNPDADRYAMFQDDALACTNLRYYLEQTTDSDKSYYNLFNFPANQKLSKGRQGWYASNQRGLGAVGLVFNRQAASTLLTSREIFERPQAKRDAHRLVDNLVATVLTKHGFEEKVHNPSLVQHIGAKTSMGSPKMPTVSTFPGVEFDILNLLQFKA